MAACGGPCAVGASARLARLCGHIAQAPPRPVRPAPVAAPTVAVRTEDLLAHFLSAPSGFAVIGASTSRAKFGNKVLRCYLQHGKPAVPVSHKETEIEGLKCVADLAALPGDASGYGISVVTPPQATLDVLTAASKLGISRVWLQPGAESPEVLARARELGIAPIHSGPCLLSLLGYSDTWEPPKAVGSGSAADGAVRWRIDDRFVLTITLANQRKHNPLRHAVLLALRELLAMAAGPERERVRVVVLEAEGPTFSAGHDFADFLESRGRSAHAETLSLCSAVNVALQRLPQPTIAAVQGRALAGGCQLACSCDLVVASSAASFCLPGVQGGGFCHTPAVAVADRIAPRAALEMALLFEQVPAERAEQLGLANRVVPPSALRGEVRRMAEKIARSEPQHVQEGKRAFYKQVQKGTLEEKYAVVEPVMLDMFADPAQQAKMSKFLRRSHDGR